MIFSIKFKSEFFSVKDTLECGQVFRFGTYKNGYKVFTADKCAYVYNDGDYAFIECEKDDKDYFYNYFDLTRDYKAIFDGAQSENIDVLTTASLMGKGVRLLNQNLEETLFSFIVSQNNNIPRIKGIIEKLCVNLGEKKYFLDEEYYAFPTAKVMAEKDETFYKSIGLGYRAEYIRRLAENIANGFDINAFSELSTEEIKQSLIKIHGVGKKVADCVTLFGYRKGDSFPVDTWIEKVYREDLSGTETNREKISKILVDRFKENAGYYQQYLFHYKRNQEKLQKGE